MSIVNVTLGDTFDQWRIKTNSIGTQTGDLTGLATTDKSSVVAAINEIFNNDSDDMESLLDDTTPQLAGPLDLNNNNIEGSGSINITGAATFGGSVTTSGLVSVSNADISLTPHGTGKTTVTGLKLVDSMDLNGNNITGSGSIADTVTGITQSPSNNSTKLATTAYVDAQVATENSLVEMNDVTINTPTNNQTLVYNTATSKWINTSTSSGATEGFAVAVAIALG